MAVLFVMYIPLENDTLEESADLPDVGPSGSDQVDRGTEFADGVEKGERRKSVTAEGGRSRSTPPRIQVDEGDPSGGGEPGGGEPDVLKDAPKDRLRGSESTTRFDSIAETDQQGEDKPLLPLRKSDPINRSTQLLSSGSVKSLANSKEENVNQSVGKFKVSKAPEGHGVDILRPGANGSRREAREREEPKESVHDITTEVITLQEALFEVFEELKIENDVWQKNFDQDQWQIKFVVDTRECDQVLNRLTAFGLGRIAGTSVSVFPASFHYSGKSEGDDETEEKSQEAKSERREFVKSIKSRLTVAQVVGNVKSSATLTFDFLVLIILASIIAGLGLAESSSVVLVASMLISPLMGPIIGFTFGIVVKNPELWKLGVRNELIGLSICLTFGFLFGLFTGCINNTAARWGSSAAWPTAEMQARGAVRSLWVGVMIALPSGAGVALSILGGNTGSLVGVAISASLLPPAVNAGMLWGLALISAVSHPPLNPVNSTYSGVPPDCRPLLDNEYDFMYSCEMPTEAAILASVSLLLTILNIICIFLMGIIVLKIKEIAPHSAMSPATAAFWKRDLAFARSTYQTIKGRACLDMAKMAKDILSDIKAKTPDLLVDTVISDLQHDPSLYAGVPEPVQEQGIPEFLRQLSHEGHELKRRQQLRPSRETVLVGDRYYHTVGSSAAARQLVQLSPTIRNTLMESGNAQGSHRVLRVRVSTGNVIDSPQTPVSESHNNEVVMIGVQRLAPRKIGRKERLSATISLDSHLTPTVGRFKVSTIPESGGIPEGLDATSTPITTKDDNRSPSTA